MSAARGAARRSPNQARRLVAGSSKIGVPTAAVAAIGMVAISAGSVLGATSELGPIATSAWRMLLAIPLCALIMLSDAGPRSDTVNRFRNRSRARARTGSVDAAPTRNPWVELTFDTLPGVLFAAMLVCFYVAQRQSSVASASIMHNTAPLWIILVVAVSVRRVPSAMALLGIAFAIVGPALLFADSMRFSVERLQGDLIGLFAAFFYAAYFLVMGGRVTVMSPAERLVNISVGASIVLVPAALLVEPQFFPHTVDQWWTLFGVAMFAQAVGQVMLAASIPKLKPFGVAAVAPLEPVGTTLLAAALLAQTVSPLQLAGLLAAIVGVVICQSERELRTPAETTSAPVPRRRISPAARRFLVPAVRGGLQPALPRAAARS